MIRQECSDFAEALQGNEWTLFYCFECGSSQWVSRKHAKTRYRHNILWMSGCSECSEEFGGLYCTDFKAIADNPYFVTRLPISNIV